ncbi:transmembrane protein [Cyclospora cayetanensis]|uniref:Transmembrane protein n=1 Tax=Cyclospora cayetanensis TaxID=88456 RepID=A0A1D3D667_9EIME|nr:transmembrane protein [Cyclospora cayetanensis]
MDSEQNKNPVPLMCSMELRTECSEAATAPSDSRDDSSDGQKAANKELQTRGGGRVRRWTAAAATEAPEPPANSFPPVRCFSEENSNKNRESSGVANVCIVGVRETLALDGAPICQATAASAEGPLKGPLPPPQRRLQSGYVPYNPYGLSRLSRQLLELTELPFMILWVYFAYFLVIVSLTAHKVKSRVWLSALVAGALVGVGLNANAYRAIMYRGYPDVGIIVRFFLIPFGVSALSGLSHSLREDFLLVFPVDPVQLLVAITVPTVVVCSLLLSRIILLYRLQVPITLRNFFLNGSIYS